MKKRRLVKPRKVVWVMRDFINEIHNLTYEEISIESIENEPIEQFFERLRNASPHEEKAQVKLIAHKQFGVCVDDIDESEFRMFYNIEELWCGGSKQFSRDFFNRCSLGRGFATITITILHELGHLHSQQNFENYDRETAIDNLRKNYSNAVINFEYFKLPDEKAATDWAIEWLNNAENRKIAKAFEKKFFSCFA